MENEKCKCHICGKVLTGQRDLFNRTCLPEHTQQTRPRKDHLGELHEPRTIICEGSHMVMGKETSYKTNA